MSGKIVYQVIVDILLRQKAVAVVINQKDIKDDETELPTSEQPSLQKIAARVMENLHRQAQSVGYELVDNGKLFLGIFMVNAQMALDALNEPIAEDRDMIYQDAGIYSLSHTINETLRASSRVRMLMTPVTNLKKTLEEARIAYQQDELFGSKSEYAKAREILAEARQRTQERLMSEGLLKIEGCFDRVRCLAESGKPYKQENGAVAAGSRRTDSACCRTRNEEYFRRTQSPEHTGDRATCRRIFVHRRSRR